jgi:hypothetical protein
MTIEEIKNLKDKVAASGLTPEEKLALLKELNDTVVDLRKDIFILKNNKKLKEVRQDVSALSTNE